jgi:hypothetical protein
MRTSLNCLRAIGAGQWAGEMNSYQRRKRDVQYLTQRGKELEEIAIALAKQLKESGITPRLFLINGLSGDSFLTDVNQGDFALRLLSLPPL